MDKHFLVTVSNDVEHLFGVKFLCFFFDKRPDYHATLLHICLRDSRDMSRVLLEKWEGPPGEAEGHLSAGARRAIDRARQLLAEQEMPVDRIMTRTVAERYGKVKDILLESGKGLYDVIVLGRRASYSLQWLFERAADETIRKMIIDGGCTTPLWICPDPEPGRRNVLACVDDSENAYRAVDHVGYILSGDNRHAITLFHVEKVAGGESEKIFQRAVSILNSHGIGNERISRTSTWGLSASRSILAEADKGRYAAVALGMRGQGQGVLRDLNLAGGTALKLIGKIEKISLWCCP